MLRSRYQSFTKYRIRIINQVQSFSMILDFWNWLVILWTRNTSKVGTVGKLWIKNRNSGLINLYLNLIDSNSLSIGTLKINTVCLPLKFEKDETFENFTAATVSGFGDVFFKGSELKDSHPWSDGPNGREWNNVDANSFYFLVLYQTRQTKSLFYHDNLFNV